VDTKLDLALLKVEARPDAACRWVTARRFALAQEVRLFGSRWTPTRST